MYMWMSVCHCCIILWICMSCKIKIYYYNIPSLPPLTADPPTQKQQVDAPANDETGGVYKFRPHISKVRKECP